MAALGRASAVLPGVVGLGQKSAGSDLCFPRSFWLPLGTRSGGDGKHERRSQAKEEATAGIWTEGKSSFSGARSK